MLRRDRLVRMQAHQMIDACVFAFGFWLAYALRSNPVIMELFGLHEISPFSEFSWLLLLVIPAAPFVLEAQGFYTRPIFCDRQTTVWQLIKACSIMSLILILAVFLARAQIARYVTLLFGGVSVVLMFLKEELMRFYFKKQFARAPYKRRLLLVGTADELAVMKTKLAKDWESGIEIAAELNLDKVSVQSLTELLHEHSVNAVIVSAKHTYFEQMETVVFACEREGVETWLIADFVSTKLSRTSFDDFFGRPVLVFRTTPEASWQSVTKSALDFFGALALLIIASIPMLIIALLIKLTSPGPVLFKQKRSGLNGRPFTMYKFRTMVTDAEQLKHELDKLNEMSGPVFKLSKDPRVTPLGRILRKFSVDEFPQLFNVLSGDMSLVGPRPLPEYEVKRFDDVSHRRRLSVKPGLTCLWQVSGRNEVKDFKDWVRLDLQYIDNWSIWLDLRILLRTIPVVLFGTGAK